MPAATIAARAIDDCGRAVDPGANASARPPIKPAAAPPSAPPLAACASPATTAEALEKRCGSRRDGARPFGIAEERHLSCARYAVTGVAHHRDGRCMVRMRGQCRQRVGGSQRVQLLGDVARVFGAGRCEQTIDQWLDRGRQRRATNWLVDACRRRARGHRCHSTAIPAGAPSALRSPFPALPTRPSSASSITSGHTNW